MPELLVLNKMDAASADQLTALRSSYPDAAVISARTGWGIDQLRAMTRCGCLGQLSRSEPWFPTHVVTFDRIHRTGELLVNEHTSEGTLVLARVNAALAAELVPYEVVAVESNSR